MRTASWTDSVSVLDRVTAVFDAFGEDDEGLGVSELARRANLPKSTVSRIAADLVAQRFLDRDGELLYLGVRLFELGQTVPQPRMLRRLALPVMRELRDVTAQTVQLGVLDGEDVLFVERLSAPGAVINVTRIAGRLPLHASSSGLVLLAFGSRELQERVYGLPLAPVTPNTITDPARLREVLAGIRRNGYVITNGHIHLDATGIAVPVRDGSDRVVASLSAVVPNDGRAYPVVPVLRAAARGISRRLPH